MAHFDGGTNQVIPPRKDDLAFVRNTSYPFEF